MNARVSPLRVSIVAVPDAVISTLSGLYDAMNAFTLMRPPGSAENTAPFRVEIVGEAEGSLGLASGLPIRVQRAVDTVENTDIVIVPSFLLTTPQWDTGRYPKLVRWVRDMHGRGAAICSACSGLFLIAETGLFDGQKATIHFGYADAFSKVFPAVSVHPAQPLVVSGAREELISSGASTSWHDLVLYLFARYAGATSAQTVAHMFALQWHRDGLAPYMTFEGRTDHGDSDILAAQRWLDTHFSVAAPIEEMIARSGLPDRTFKRRFTGATGLAPIAYVQRLRIEDAKRRLERTAASVDEISWQVGYEDPAFFRRLFKRTTGLPPGTYRKRFSVPQFAQIASNRP